MSIFHKPYVRHAAILTVIVTVLHFTITTHSHGLHWVHIVLAGAYLIPVLVAAVTYERTGGLIVAAGVSVLYLLHLLWSWRDSPMANLDQFAWLAIYPFVGLVTGQLVHVANEHNREHAEIMEQSRHAELINGITGLLTAVGVRDKATVEHSQRVAEMAKLVGSEFGLDVLALSNLYLAALVHDIGKVGIPDAILFNHGRLDNDQMSVMCEHVELAVSMLIAIPGTEQIALLVAQHHESPDGSGYPHGLSGDQINPAASVLHVADVYCALTEERMYHEAMTKEEAIEAMEKIIGDKLDTAAFRSLCRIVDASGDSESGSESYEVDDGGNG